MSRSDRTSGPTSDRVWDRAFDRLWKVALGLFLLASLAVDLLLPGKGKEPAHLWEHDTFFAWYGLLGCIAIILGSKALGKRLLQRPEDYYRQHRREGDADAD